MNTEFGFDWDTIDKLVYKLQIETSDNGKLGTSKVPEPHRLRNYNVMKNERRTKLWLKDDWALAFSSDKKIKKYILVFRV